MWKLVNLWHHWNSKKIWVKEETNKQVTTATTTTKRGWGGGGGEEERKKLVLLVLLSIIKSLKEKIDSWYIVCDLLQSSGYQTLSILGSLWQTSMYGNQIWFLYYTVGILAVWATFHTLTVNEASFKIVMYKSVVLVTLLQQSHRVTETSHPEVTRCS